MIKIVTIVMVLLAISCGKLTPRSQTSLKVNYIDSSDGEPILLEMKGVGEVCPSIANGNPDQDIYINLFTDWNMVRVPYRQRLLNRAGKIDNTLLNTTTISGEVGFYEKFLGPRSFSINILKAPTELTICPGFDYTDDNTYESAAVSALYSFKKVEEAMVQLPVNLPKVELRIAPLVNYQLEYIANNKINRETKKLVNNAFYFGKRREIIFLPQGINKDGRIPFTNVPLWKLPFVGAHEYGHHFFGTIVANHINDEENSNHENISLCFDNAEQFDKSDRQKDGDPRQVTFNDVIDAINEGFADLFAQVVIDEKYNLVGVGCLEYTRDVDNRLFASGKIKRIDNKVLDLFFHNKRVKIKNCYANQDYQDPHIIGTIIAHGINELMQVQNLTQKQKLEAMLTWLMRINTNYHDLRKMPLQDALTTIVLWGVQSSVSDSYLYKSELCRILGQSLPMISNYYSCK